MERINSQTILAKRRSKQRKQKLVRGLAIVLALMVIWKFFGSAVTWIRQWQSDEVYDVSAEEFPQYGWRKNKGYPTREHRLAIREYGLTPHHRLTFNHEIDQLELPF